VRLLLGLYVDGELSGADRLRVSRHLNVCADCASDVDAMVGMGDLLRRAAAKEAVARPLEGLASGVVARVRAESAVSWGARLERAVGDSRLLWVGTGSVLGAMATMLLVAFTLFFGQTRAMAGGLEFSPAGTLLAVAQQGDGVSGGMLLQFNAAHGTRVITEAMLTGPSERQLIAALADLMMPRGRVRELSEMGPRDRAETEALLDEFLRRQTKELVRVEVQQVRLLTTTDVSAKGL
jgi:anti-sigma factor RsiW